ncbi:hypothetical protein ACFFX0_04825 [Citricoccus parietis]|uniref:Glutamine amidotransferase domain-containing protein n=1 Tax=Citricoccus parietis TaxID=592307 RepID=A0ABV5FV49_9MICC
MSAGPEVSQQADGHGDGLLGGQEGALLQALGGLKVMYPVQVHPEGVLPDDPGVLGGQGADLRLEPGLEAFDVQVHRLQ